MNFYSQYTFKVSLQNVHMHDYYGNVQWKKYFIKRESTTSIIKYLGFNSKHFIPQIKTVLLSLLTYFKSPEIILTKNLYAEGSWFRCLSNGNSNMTMYSIYLWGLKTEDEFHHNILMSTVTIILVQTFITYKNIWDVKRYW
jgi:hypothetical protein